MWFDFSVAFFLYVAILFIPAYYFLSALQVDQRISLSMAPAITAFSYSLSGIVLYFLGIKSSPLTIIFPWTFTFLVIGIFIRLKDGHDLLSDLLFIDFHIPLLYILIGTLVTTMVLVANLDGATAFFQDGTDNYYHLNAVRSFAQSGDMSCLSSSIFEHSASATVGTSFYPAEWHVLAALCMQTLNIEPTICINALNTTLISVVFPLGLYSFLVSIDSTNRSLHIAGSVTALSVCACPWEFIIWGPLYANLLGLVFILSVSSCFIILLNGKTSNPRAPIALFITGCCAITLAQPNCIMTMGVILAPFLVYRCFIFFKEKGMRAIPLAGIVAIAIVAFWIICRNSPIFSKVATFHWVPFLDSKTATLNVLELTLIYNPAQCLVVVCAVTGLVRIFVLRQNRWLCFSPLFFAIAYIICISSDGLLRTYLSGFWYNDYYRIACMYGLCLIPLVTYGLESIIRVVDLVISKVRKTPHPARTGIVIQLIPIILFGLICFRMNSSIQLFNNGTSCFDFLAATIKYQYTLKSPTASLTTGDTEFLKNVEAITGTQDLVINDPHDGSVYAYGLSNINTYYRWFFLPTNNDISDLIRTKLADIAFNDQVKDAARSINAKYVLILDYDFNGKSGTKYFDFYERDDWRGIHNISENTPGFELLLADDGRRLYRITALD